MNAKFYCYLLIAGLFALSACGESADEAVDPAEAVTVSSNPKTGKPLAGTPPSPSAPIKFRYEVQGSPIVGQPVAINVFVSSSIRETPINVTYSVVDASSMSFPESQSKVAEFVSRALDEPLAQQITVIPQREGRLYLNVSAEIETEDGSMIKTTAIPVQVGSAPLELDVNGELLETESGEKVISMPSQ